MEPDTVVADVALFDPLENLWPTVGMKLFVLGNLFGFDSDHHSHALHSSPQI
jgi:hypothetical protein